MLTPQLHLIRKENLNPVLLRPFSMFPSTIQLGGLNLQLSVDVGFCFESPLALR